MPQLAIETYCSQIFWVLLGFLAVYFFVSKIVAGEVESIFKQRSSYIDNLKSEIDNITSEAKKLEKESTAVLEDAEIAISEKESVIIASFREQNISEKERLYKDFSKKTLITSEKLSKEASDSFSEISGDIKFIVNAAIQSLNRNTSMEVRHNEYRR